MPDDHIVGYKKKLKTPFYIVPEFGYPCKFVKSVS